MSIFTENHHRKLESGRNANATDTDTHGKGCSFKQNPKMLSLKTGENGINFAIL